MVNVANYKQKIDICAIPSVGNGNDIRMDEDLGDVEHVGDLSYLGLKMLKMTCEFELRFQKLQINLRTLLNFSNISLYLQLLIEIYAHPKNLSAK